MKERINKVIKNISLILIIGLGYAGVCMFTDFGIPCMFRVVTGYKCAGCGVTHMFLAMLRLDFKEAYYSNQLFFCMLPFAAIYVLRLIYKYIKDGNMKTGKIENILLYMVVVVLVIWGVVRNFF